MNLYGDKKFHKFAVLITLVAQAKAFSLKKSLYQQSMKWYKTEKNFYEEIVFSKIFSIICMTHIEYFFSVLAIVNSAMLWLNDDDASFLI